jgi:AcrR family transcriptional regulator
MARAKEAAMRAEGRADMRQQALKTARRLFVEEGYAEFSMRKVARELGIRQGHLQHYFATRDDLLTEMLEEALHSYIDEYEKFRDDVRGNAEQQLDLVIKFLLGDINNSQVSKFFLELWPMTAHYQEVLLMLRDIYRRNWEGFSTFVENFRSDLDVETVRAISLQVLALVDGLIIYCHSAVPTKRELERVRARAYSSIWLLLREEATSKVD